MQAKGHLFWAPGRRFASQTLPPIPHAASDRQPTRTGALVDLSTAGTARVHLLAKVEVGGMGLVPANMGALVLGANRFVFAKGIVQGVGTRRQVGSLCPPACSSTPK